MPAFKFRAAGSANFTKGAGSWELLPPPPNKLSKPVINGLRPNPAPMTPCTVLPTVAAMDPPFEPSADDLSNSPRLPAGTSDFGHSSVATPPPAQPARRGPLLVS